MMALFVWLPDELNKNFVEYCKVNNLPKAHAARTAIGLFLESEKNESTGTNSGVEATVSESELERKQAA